MIKSKGLFTYELDDADVAVSEIQDQLKDFPLLPNSVGIVMCDPEFLESGIYQAVAAALPFPVAGATTLIQAVNHEAGVLMLTIFVLSSDDAKFSIGYSDPIADGGSALEPTRAAFEQARAELGETPKLIILFPPLLPLTSGDTFVDCFTALCPNVPLFGTLAVSDRMTFDNCSTLARGGSSMDRMSFILVGGNVAPRFFVSTISDRNKTPYTGEITKSEGNVVMEINDTPAGQYLERIGLVQNGEINKGILFVPFLLDVKKKDDWDGVPVMRGMVMLDKNGYGICRGNMYQNSIFNITTPGPDDIMDSLDSLTKKIQPLADQHAVLMFSCVVRRIALGADPMREADTVKDRLSDGAPLMLAYAGGEICPTSYGGGKVTNRFHNYTLIACVL